MMTIFRSSVGVARCIVDAAGRVRIPGSGPEIMQSREVASRLTHNQEIAGSSPASATKSVWSSGKTSVSKTEDRGSIPRTDARLSE